MKITTVGIDLAKNVFTVYGADEHGKTVLRQTLRRAKLLEVLAQTPFCVVDMKPARDRNIGHASCTNSVTMRGSWRRSLSNLIAREARTTTIADRQHPYCLIE
jgi:transposase